eukprot:gnl/TRDRNA2_/TRDRNA2_81695_c1_seq1.p1 gnl/TRDRNA2_/TRDRNA2_81695_c1~~gnl/TRDRNA2_/TRDRNA2_81695_c1_seq1.p1  ORF type:complete len:580 (-),score=130.18 gnl/TRDRNA2_/TRDRNA2_81695_c1_seq1:154-1893(-)
MVSILAGVQEYVQAMIDRIPGMKILILDEETVGMMSMVFTQSEILNHEVFLVEQIGSEQTERLRHLNAICFLRPTNQNFILLSQELKSPKYNEYHLFFTNVVAHMRLEQLACCDEYEVVHQVQEFYADVYAVNHDLFSLNIPSTIRLHEAQTTWSSYEDSIFERTIEGLLSVCFALKMLPAIRYSASSELCRQIAFRLQARLTEEQSLFDAPDVKEAIDRETRGGGGPVLILLDRRNDPVTPLLNQWTYQAMLHELLEIKNNRIDMSKVPGVKPEMKEVVMSTAQDTFMQENMLANFGDLGVAIKNYVEEYQKATKNTSRIESIEDMQRFVDEYPEFRRMSGNVSKHVAVVQELSRIIETNNLMQASQVEQEIACSENRQEHFRAVTEMLRGQSITNMQRLRLVLLYALRYEHDGSISQLKDLLRSKGISEDHIGLLDQLLRYAGSHVRGGDLFQNKTFLAQAKSTITKGFKGVDNVYTQHKTQLGSVANSLLQGKLKEASYPFAERHTTSASATDKVARAVVFVVGGTTFEEARDVTELNRTLVNDGRSVILGGTTIHNSRSFLADVAQLNRSGAGLE